MSKTKDIALPAVKIKAASVEGERLLRVIATAPTLDRDLEIISSESIRIPVKPSGLKYLSDMTPEDKPDVPFLIDHEWALEKQAGSVQSIFINADGETETVVKLSTVDNGERVYTLAKEGHLGNSFSIGYSLQNATLEDGEIKHIEMLELSAVFKGSNRHARLLEVKSIKEEKSMALSQEELDAKKAELEKLQAEIKAAETDEVEEVVAPTVEDEQAEATQEEPKVEEEVKEEEPAVEAEPEAEAEAKTEEAVEEPEEETKSIKKESTKMADQNEIAVKQVVDSAPVQAVKEVKKDTKSIRENFAMQIDAMVRKDSNAVAKFAKEGAEMAGKAIDGTSGADLFVDEVVANDIVASYNNVGRVGALVDRESIVADTLKILVESAGTGFQPVALGAEKSEDQPVWTPVSFEPFEWAVIVPWLDGVQKRTTINIYNQVVNYIAREYAKLEDKIVLTYAGGTVGTETRPATGLVPILTAAGRTTTLASYSSADIASALGTAYGGLETDGTVTLVANRSTWSQLAVAVDGDGNTVFNTVGQQVAAGALGTFNVVLSEALADGDIVVGDYSYYLIVTRGGLGTLFSREATVGTLNLFTQDASALRADVDITGGVKRAEAFSLVRLAAPAA